MREPGSAERSDGEDPRVLGRLERERGMLQKVVGLAGLVPVAAGLYGVLFAGALTGERLSIAGDSHYRYLCGLLLAIGLLYWSTIPAIEATGARFRLLSLVVMIGGLARLFGMAVTGQPSLSMIGALGMELGVTPFLCLWQWRIARAYAEPDPQMPKRKTSPKPAPVAPSLAPSPPHPGTVLPEDFPEPIPDAASVAKPASETPTSSEPGRKLPSSLS